MRAIVCGSRYERDQAFVFAMLDKIDGRERIGVVIEGGQRRRSSVCGPIVGGVDFHASMWAGTRGRRQVRIDADWTRLGKRAGPERNGRMLKEAPDVVIAFPGGSGTADMVRQACAAGVRVIEVMR